MFTVTIIFIALLVIIFRYRPAKPTSTQLPTYTQQPAQEGSFVITINEVDDIVQESENSQVNTDSESHHCELSIQTECSTQSDSTQTEVQTVEFEVQTDATIFEEMETQTQSIETCDSSVQTDEDQRDDKIKRLEEENSRLKQSLQRHDELIKAQCLKLSKYSETVKKHLTELKKLKTELQGAKATTSQSTPRATGITPVWNHLSNGEKPLTTNITTTKTQAFKQCSKRLHRATSRHFEYMATRKRGEESQNQVIEEPENKEKTEQSKRTKMYVSNVRATQRVKALRIKQYLKPRINKQPLMDTIQPQAKLQPARVASNTKKLETQRPAHTLKQPEIKRPATQRMTADANRAKQSRDKQVQQTSQPKAVEHPSVVQSLLSEGAKDYLSKYWWGSN